MTKDELITLCARHGWSYHRVGRIVGMAKDTPSRWAAGTVGMNPAAGRLLEVLDHVPQAMAYAQACGWMGRSVGRPKKVKNT